MKGDFLAAMAASSRERVALAQRDEPLEALRRRARHAPAAPRMELGAFGVIAEIKLAAPSADVPTTALPIAERVPAYRAGGACAISVLTEPTQFAGALVHLREVVRHAGDIPALRKDFVVSPYQVLEARAAGAGGVLLIAEMLDDAALDACLREARACELFVLLEAFGARHIERARSRATDPDEPAPVLSGVNCRDLRTLRIDPARFEQTRRASNGPPAAIAESGMRTPADVEAVASLGYRGVLVGTALMRAADPAALVAAMRTAGRRGRCASV